MNHLNQIEQNIFDYFKDFNNQTLVLFIESFSYHKAAGRADISALVTKFLKDQEMEKLYVDYVSDTDMVRGESSYFLKNSRHAYEIIDHMKTALNNLCFNRMRQMDFTPVKNTLKTEATLKPPIKIEWSGNGEVEAGTVCITQNKGSEYTLCMLYRDGVNGKAKYTEKEVNCSHCLEIVNFCKTIKA